MKTSAMMTVMAVAVGCACAVIVGGCSTGPARERVEADLRHWIPNNVMTACRCIGGPQVNAIKSVDISGDGTGTALVNVSAGGIFCPPATCDITVKFKYLKLNSGWEMASVE